MDSPSESPTKDKKKNLSGLNESTGAKVSIWWCFSFLIINIILSFFVFIYIGTLLKDDVYWTDYPEAKDVIDYMVINMKARPFNAISVTSEEKCTSLDDFNVGVWPGTVQGCNCTSGMHNHTCSPQEIKEGCNSFHIPPKDLPKWTTQRFCVGRNNAVKYAQSNCDQGWKKCSDGYTCVPASDACPLYNLKIIQEAEPVPEGHEVIELEEDSQRLIYSRNTKENQTPLVLLEVSMNMEACAALGHTPLAKTTAFFPLLENPTPGCGRYGTDNLYTFIVDVQKEETLYITNNVYDDLVGTLHGYGEYLQGRDIALLGRRAIRMAHDWCQNLKWDLFEDSAQHLFYVRIALVTVAVIGIVMMSFQVIFLLPVLLSIAKAQFCCDWSKGYKWLSGFFLFFHITWGIAFLIVGVVVIGAYKVMIDRRELFAQLETQRCFLNTSYDEAVEFFVNKEGFVLIYRSFNAILVLFIVQAVEFLIFLITLCVLGCSGTSLKDARNYFGTMLRCGKPLPTKEEINNEADEKEAKRRKKEEKGKHKDKEKDSERKKKHEKDYNRGGTSTEMVIDPNLPIESERRKNVDRFPAPVDRFPTPDSSRRYQPQFQADKYGPQIEQEPEPTQHAIPRTIKKSEFPSPPPKRGYSPFVEEF